MTQFVGQIANEDLAAVVMEVFGATDAVHLPVRIELFLSQTVILLNGKRNPI